MLINAEKVKRNKAIDKAARMFFLAMALLSSSFIVILVLFIFMKGISPFLPNYQYGTVNLIDFLLV